MNLFPIALSLIVPLISSKEKRNLRIENQIFVNNVPNPPKPTNPSQITPQPKATSKRIEDDDSKDDEDEDDMPLRRENPRTPRPTPDLSGDDETEDKEEQKYDSDTEEDEDIKPKGRKVLPSPRPTPDLSGDDESEEQEEQKSNHTEKIDEEDESEEIPSPSISPQILVVTAIPIPTHSKCPYLCAAHSHCSENIGCICDSGFFFESGACNQVRIFIRRIYPANSPIGGGGIFRVSFSSHLADSISLNCLIGTTNETCSRIDHEFFTCAIPPSSVPGDFFLSFYLSNGIALERVATFSYEEQGPRSEWGPSALASFAVSVAASLYAACLCLYHCIQLSRSISPKELFGL